MIWKMVKLVLLLMAAFFLHALTKNLHSSGGKPPPARAESAAALQAPVSPASQVGSSSIAPFQASQANAGATAALAPPPVKLWESPAWKKCLANFKRTTKRGGDTEVVHFVDGRCIAPNQPFAIPEGTCFMKAVSPSDILNATKFETQFACKEDGEERMVCTDKKGHYMHAMTDGMAQDKRCDGFPNLLAIDMHKKGPNKALEALLKSKPNSPECVRQVRKIRRLENDPRFDEAQSIRVRWADEEAIGVRMGCEF